MVKVQYSKEANLLDEPFYRMRNRIIEDLRGVWTPASYWNKFGDKSLLYAVMTRMQVQGDLISRFEGTAYEWMVHPAAKLTKIAISSFS